MGQPRLLIYLRGSSRHHSSPTLCQLQLPSAASCFSFASLRETKPFQVLFKKNQKKPHKTKRDKNSVCPLSFLQCNVWAAPRWMMYVQSLSQGEEGTKTVFLCAPAVAAQSVNLLCRTPLEDKQTSIVFVCVGGGGTSWLLNVFTYCKSF